MKIVYFKILLIFLMALPAQVFPVISSGDGGYISQGVPNSEITLTAEERVFLNSHDLRCAMAPNWSPINMYDQNKQLVGIAVDYWKLISKKLNMNIDCDVKESFSEVLQAIENRDADFMMATSMTDERKRYAEFSKAYVSFPIAIATTVDTDYMVDETALFGKRVAVGRGYSAHQILTKDNPSIEFVEVDNTRVGLQMLAANEVFAVVDSLPVLQQLIKQGKHNTIKIAGTARYDIGLRLMVRSDYPQLAVIFNKAIDMISAQEHQIILSRWLDPSAINDQSIVFTPAEQAWIAENHPIRVSFWQHPPIFYTKDGKVVGIAVDLLDKISENTGLSFQYENRLDPFADVLKGLKDHNGPDLVGALMPSAEREKSILFTRSYFNSPRFIFTRDDAPFISSIENLNGKNVAVVKDYVIHHTLIEKYPDIDLLIFQDNEEALRAVSMGQAFAFIGDLVATPAMINEFGLKNIKAACPSGLPDHPLAMGIRNDWPELRNIIDKALGSIPVAEKTAIINKWDSVQFDYGISPHDVKKWVLSVAAVTLLIILFFLIWNRLLHQKVKERTAEILEKESRFRRLVEQTPMAIEIHDLEGKIVQTNKAFASMHNLEGEALAQVLEHYNVLKDEQAQKLGLQPYIERVYAGEDVVFPPYKYSTAEATKSLGHETAPNELWTQVRGFPLKNSAGQVINAVFFAEDITEQREAQLAVKQEREYTDHLIQSANVMIVSLDMKGLITNMNPAAEKVTGYQAAELIGQNWLEILIPPEHFPETHAALQGALSDQIPEQYENVILTQSGEERVISWSNSEIRRHDTVIGITSFGVDITEQKQAQAFLEESESRFRATFEQAAVGIAHVSPDGEFLRINQRFGNILGYTESEMLALTFQEITHPDDLEADLDRVNKLLVGEIETYSLEKKYFHKNGGIIWVNLTVSLLRTSDVKPDYFISVIEDISERKMAEMALQESEEKFRSFIEQSPTTFELYDTDGVLVQVNRAFENLWNLKADDVVNKFNVLESSQVEEVGLLPYIKRAFAGEEIGAIPDVDFNASREDVDNKEKSRERWLSNILYPVRDIQGNVTHVVMMHEDITEQKQAERKVRDSEAEFRSLIEQSPISVQILNPDGKITKVNQAFQTLWGISDEDLEEVMDTYNTFEDAQVEKLGLLPGIRKAFAGENVTLPVVEYDCPETMDNLNLAHVMSNKRWIQARLYPVKNTEGKLLNVVYMEEDMTEQRAAEIRLQEYQERLRALASELTLTEEQERRRIATELHDGAAQSLALARLKLVLVNKVVEDPKTTNKLDDLSQLLKESLQQIRGVLLDLTSPSLNEIGLGAALSEWLEEQAGRRQGLQTSFSNECEDMKLSEDMLAILFRNARELIMNTLKHAEAGRISVRLHCIDQELLIDVQDDGKGFNPDKRQKQPGSEGGFGLFSVYERMADMGGALEIESTLGQGCKATLKMPMTHLL